MAHFLVYADQPHKCRADGLNAFVVEAADAASAPAAARALMKSGVSGTTFDNFAVTEIAAGVQFVCQGCAVGQPGNSVGLPTVDRGGNVPLAAM